LALRESVDLTSTVNIEPRIGLSMYPLDCCTGAGRSALLPRLQRLLLLLLLPPLLITRLPARSKCSAPLMEEPADDSRVPNMGREKPSIEAVDSDSDGADRELMRAGSLTTSVREAGA